MIVVGILGVLIAISIPFFLGTRIRAYDSAARTGAAHAMEAGRVVYSDNDSYATATPATLAAVEPSLTFVDDVTSSDGPATASSDTPDALTTGKTLIIAVFSKSGTCFFMRDVADGGVTYAELSGGKTSDCHASNTGSLAFGATW